MGLKYRSRNEWCILWRVARDRINTTGHLKNKADAGFLRKKQISMKRLLGCRG